MFPPPPPPPPAPFYHSMSANDIADSILPTRSRKKRRLTADSISAMDASIDLPGLIWGQDSFNAMYIPTLATVLILEHPIFGTLPQEVQEICRELQQLTEAYPPHALDANQAAICSRAILALIYLFKPLSLRSYELAELQQDHPDRLNDEQAAFILNVFLNIIKILPTTHSGLLFNRLLDECAFPIIIHLDALIAHSPQFDNHLYSLIVRFTTLEEQIKLLDFLESKTSGPTYTPDISVLVKLLKIIEDQELRTRYVAFLQNTLRNVPIELLVLFFKQVHTNLNETDPLQNRILILSILTPNQLCLLGNHVREIKDEADRLFVFEYLLWYVQEMPNDFRLTFLASAFKYLQRLADPLDFLDTLLLIAYSLDLIPQENHDVHLMYIFNNIVSKLEDVEITQETSTQLKEIIVACLKFFEKYWPDETSALLPLAIHASERVYSIVAQHFSDLNNSSRFNK